MVVLSASFPERILSILFAENTCRQLTEGTKTYIQAKGKMSLPTLISRKSIPLTYPKLLLLGAVGV